MQSFVRVGNPFQNEFRNWLSDTRVVRADRWHCRSGSATSRPSPGRPSFPVLGGKLCPHRGVVELHGLEIAGRSEPIGSPRFRKRDHVTNKRLEGSDKVRVIAPAAHLEVLPCCIREVRTSPPHRPAREEPMVARERLIVLVPTQGAEHEHLGVDERTAVALAPADHTHGAHEMLGHSVVRPEDNRRPARCEVDELWEDVGETRTLES